MCYFTKVLGLYALAVMDIIVFDNITDVRLMSLSFTVTVRDGNYKCDHCTQCIYTSLQDIQSSTHKP